MQSIAQQSVEELGGPKSILVLQRRDHAELERLLEEMEATNGDDRVLTRLYRLVFPHAFAEETILWPALRRVAGEEGERLTLKNEREHQEVNQLVTALELMPRTSPERPAALARLAAVLRTDARDEEDELLPRLQAGSSVRRLQALGAAWQVVRWTAPTRAHPGVSRRPAGNVVAAAPLSIVDRARDAVDAALASERGRGNATLGRVGAALRGVSHRLEKVPVMKHGEDPSTRAEPAEAATSLR